VEHLHFGIGERQEEKYRRAMVHVGVNMSTKFFNSIIGNYHLLVNGCS